MLLAWMSFAGNATTEINHTIRRLPGELDPPHQTTYSAKHLFGMVLVVHRQDCRALTLASRDVEGW